MNSEMLNEVLTNISKDLEIEVNKTEISEEELLLAIAASFLVQVTLKV